MGTFVSKRMLPFVFSCLLVCATGAGLASCTSPDQGTAEQGGQTPATQQNDTVKVTVEVDSSAADGEELKQESVEVSEGATVLDALEASGLDYSASSGQYGTYVTNIDGLAEKDHGASSGWMFLINGEYATEAADVCTLADGDTVTWEYFAGDAAPSGDAL